MAESEEDYCDDDYSQTTEYSFQNRMQNNYQHTMTKAELRRSTKPIMEKRRRARINRCLNELKSLILDAMKKDPARHSKLEKADILEMTVKHLQNVQKRQLSAAMVADPGVMHKFRGGFEECATEVGRYIEGLDGIDMGVRRRLAAHLSSCVTNIPASRNDINADTNNNSSSRVNAISASLRLIPSRLPNGELALLVPDAQSLPNNVLPFFQLAEHTKLAPNVGHQGFNQVTTTTIDKLTDTLRLDTSPLHPSAFTAVNKQHATAERTPSPTLSSVSSSADRNAPATINNMSSEVSSTSEQLAESSTDPSSSFNSSTSSLSPQNTARNPPPPSSRLSPNYQNSNASALSPHTYPPQYMQSRSHLQNALQSSPKQHQQMDDGKTVEDVGYNLSQKHHQEEGYAAPKFSYPDFPKTDHASDRFPKQNSIRFPQTEYMDGLKSYESFPLVKEQQETFGSKRQLDLKSSEFSLPLTVETNLERCTIGKLSAGSVNGLPAPIDYSKNIGVNHFQNTFVPSLKRRRLEAASTAKCSSSKPAEFGESQSFSPRIIIQHNDKSDAQNSEDLVTDTPRNSGSEASTSENMWRPW